MIGCVKILTWFKSIFLYKHDSVHTRDWSSHCTYPILIFETTTGLGRNIKQVYSSELCRLSTELITDQEFRGRSLRLFHKVSSKQKLQ